MAINIIVNLITIIVIMQSRKEELQGKKNREDSLSLTELPDFSSRKIYKTFPTNINVLLILIQILTTKLEVSGLLL